MHTFMVDQKARRMTLKIFEAAPEIVPTKQSSSATFIQRATAKYSTDTGWITVLMSLILTHIG